MCRGDRQNIEYADSVYYSGGHSTLDMMVRTELNAVIAGQSVLDGIFDMSI